LGWPGDFNGDGYTDIFTAAYYSYTSIFLTSAASGNEEQMLNTGCGLIYLGGPDMDDIPDAIIIPPDDIIKHTTIDPSISGAYEWAYAGYRVYNAGDTDGDGTDDLSLPTQFWDVSMIYSGVSSLTQANSLDETTIIREPAHWWSKDRYTSGYYQDQHGANMVPVGDVDGDGLADLVTPAISLEQDLMNMAFDYSSAQCCVLVVWLLIMKRQITFRFNHPMKTLMGMDFLIWLP